jgi:Leucine-rich repeat (LRR) protein
MRGTAVGQTGPGRVVEIPSCRFWFVAPTDPNPDWQMTAAEVARRNVPGLHVSRATDVDLSHLASLKHLTYLAVSDSDNVTDAGLEAIADLTNLQMLVLSNCDNIADSALKNLEGLERMQMLFLNCTRFTGAGLVHVKNLKDLRVLWADYNNTEPDLEHVKDLEKLQALILIEARTTDAGLEHLKTLKNLERLALESANITDAGLKHLEALKNLKMLYFDSAQCTEAAVESLREALPNCEVVRQ